MSAAIRLVTPLFPSDHTGTVVLDRFRLDRKIGEGRWGVAYLAQDTKGGALAVVKIGDELVPAAGLSETARRAFDDASKIDAPRVGRLLDHGTTADGHAVVATAYVAGDGFDELLASREGPLDAFGAEVLAQIGEALVSLHAAGLVHGSLAARNVLVGSTSDGRPKAVVTDVAMRRLLGPGSCHAESGDDDAAPEEFVGRRGPAADVFALGAIVWWAVTGRPYRRDVLSIDDLARVQMAGLPVGVLGQAEVDLPEPMAQLLRDMLALDDSARITARDFVARWPEAVAALQSLPLDTSVPETEDAAPEPTTPVATPSTRSLRVAVVDLDMVTRLLTLSCLREAGCDIQVVQAASELPCYEGAIDLVVVAGDDLRAEEELATVRRRSPDVAMVRTACNLTDRDRALPDVVSLELPVELDRLGALLSRMRSGATGSHLSAV